VLKFSETTSGSKRAETTPQVSHQTRKLVGKIGKNCEKLQEVCKNARFLCKNWQKLTFFEPLFSAPCANGRAASS
jgi:hypothetical protein